MTHRVMIATLTQELHNPKTTAPCSPQIITVEEIVVLEILQRTFSCIQNHRHPFPRMIFHDNLRSNTPFQLWIQDSIKATINDVPNWQWSQ
jgi:hypothetical protein